MGCILSKFVDFDVPPNSKEPILKDLSPSKRDDLLYFITSRALHDISRSWKYINSSDENSPKQFLEFLADILGISPEDVRKLLNRQKIFYDESDQKSIVLSNHREPENRIDYCVDCGVDFRWWNGFTFLEDGRARNSDLFDAIFCC